MSQGTHTGRWGHRALNLALLALGGVAVALLYALASQYLGTAAASSRPSQQVSGATAAAPSPASGEGREALGQAPADEIIQVGVRNGCGEDGVAADARNYLVRSGFDVVEVGNYSTFSLDSSMVIDRVGNRAAARRVARALGIPARRVQQEVGDEYYLDATVVLGADYRTLKPFREEAAAPAAR